MPESECPNKERLLAFFRGELAEDVEDTIVDHIDVCTKCERKLAVLEAQAACVLDQLAAGGCDPKYLEEQGFHEAAELVWNIGRELPPAELDEESTPKASELSTLDVSLAETEDFVPAAKRNGAMGDVVGRTQSTPASLPEIPGYEVLGFIARGGMGMVVKARHLVLNRTVAIKVPRAHMLTDDGDRQRFLREARAAAKLSHVAICPIYEVGQANGLPYLAMAYIEGTTLDQWVSQSKPNARQIAEMMALLTHAVAYAHDNDVLHRDLKPSNVMVDQDSGHPVLMDFGLAKELAGGAEEASLTVTGQVMGTPSYMAPEQAAGHIDEIGRHTDIYALGAILYYLICNRAPFSGNLSEVLHGVQNEDPPRPSKLVPRLHRDLETICLRSMAKEPSARYSSARDLAEDLERFCAGEPIQARRQGVLERAARVVRRRPSVTVFVALTFVLTTALLLLGWRSLRTAEVKRLRDQFTTNLDTQNWTAEHVEQQQHLVEQIGQIDSPTERELGTLLLGRFADHLEELIGSPRLSADIRAQIESELGIMHSLDTSLAARFRQAFNRRLRDWEPIFRLRSPMEQIDNVFDPDKITLTEGVLFARDAPELVTSRLSSGKVRLEAEFADDWDEATFLGLCIGFDRRQVQGVPGYRFEIHSRGSDPVTDEPADFAAVRDAGGKFQARILRNGLLLRQDSVSVPAGLLRLTVHRDVQRLTFQINDLPPFEFFDPFPLADHADRVFAVTSAAGVGLQELSASRQPLALQPSPLEIADELFLQGDPSEALVEYERQAVISGDSVIAQEARCKQAQCLAGLKRFSEARPILESVAKGSGEQWPALADCLLWEIHLEESGPDVAYGIFENIALKYKPAKLRKFVPAHVIHANVFKYREGASGLQLLEYNPNRVSNLQRAIRIHDFFGVNDLAYYESQLYLCRALCIDGEYDQARAVIAQLIDDFPEVTKENRRRWFQVWETYGWLMRMDGQTDKAMAQLDQRLFATGGTVHEPHFVLLIERARMQMDLGRAEQAASDLDKFFALADRNTLEYEYWSGASLVHGFVLERLGQTDTAQEVWLAGLPTPPYDWIKLRRIEGLLNGVVLASLTGGMAEQQMSDLVDRVIDKLSRTFNRVLIESTMGMLLDDFTPDVMSRISGSVYAGPSGREFARQIAFRELPVLTMMQKTLAALTASGANEMLFDGEMLPEQQQLMLQLGEEWFDSYYKGEFTRTHLLQLGLSWKGFPGAGGWESLANELKPSLRGPLAYALGLRYQRRTQTVQAMKFFQAALNDALPDSSLARLAKVELQRIEGVRE